MTMCYCYLALQTLEYVQLKLHVLHSIFQSKADPFNHTAVPIAAAATTVYYVDFK